MPDTDLPDLSSTTRDRAASSATQPGPLAASLPRPERPVEVHVNLSDAHVPPPPPPPPKGQPGFLFFGAHRRSGTTWLTSLLNSHREIHIRNEGWLFNDRGGSFETWFNHDRFNAWAAGREARGTWLRHMSPAAAAKVMQQAMLREVFKEATVRENWKKWDELRWCGDKTTNFYNLAVDVLFDIFPPQPPCNGRFLSMVRDGRDVVVSNLFLAFREQAWVDLPADAVAHAQAAFEFHVRGRGKPVPLFNAPLLKHLINEWLRVIYGARRAAELYGETGAFLEVRYESLVDDTAAEIRRVYDWLGVTPLSDDQLAETIDRLKFENLSGGRKRGDADPMAEWRKGVVGDWRNHFTEDDKRLFKTIAGSLLVELGYERDLEW